MAATYTTKPGQHWDEIAKEVYGSETHSDYLMANNFPLLDFYSFEAGIALQIPPLPEDRRNLPSWRKTA